MMNSLKVAMYTLLVLAIATNTGCRRSESIDLETDPRGSEPYGVTFVDGRQVVYFNNPDSINAAIHLANANNAPVYVHTGSYQSLVKVIPQAGFTGEGTISYNKTLIYAPDVDFVGIPHNLEQQVYTYPNLITSGELISPPIATPLPNKPVDILASFYNDFGLQSKALAPYAGQGWYGWYDWQWNFTTHANYDSARHPLLGWYRGDDPKVLDWTCYWLVKYGVRGVILTNRFETTNWSSPADKHHWLYQLFNNTPNFESLKYSVFLSATSNALPRADAVRIDYDLVDNVIANFPNVYCYEKDGKRYPVFYMWDREAFRGSHDQYNGSTNSVNHLINLSNRCKNLGYDGICVYANAITSASWPVVSTALPDNDVIVFNQDYSAVYQSGGPYGTYANYANNTPFPTDSTRILNVMTSAKTQLPHYSGWNLGGTTPALFKTALQRAVDVTLNTNKPKTVVVYNVSEWAEGGPGLIPNQKDRYGYLEAIRDLDYTP